MATEPDRSGKKPTGGLLKTFKRFSEAITRSRRSTDEARSPGTSTPATTNTDALVTPPTPVPEESLLAAKERQKGNEVSGDDGAQDQQSPPRSHDLADGMPSSPLPTKEDVAELWDAAYDGLKEQYRDPISAYEEALPIQLRHLYWDQWPLPEDKIAQYRAERRAEMAKVVDASLNGNAELLRGRNYSSGDLPPRLVSVREVVRSLIERFPMLSILWAATCLSLEAKVCHGAETKAFGSAVITLTSRSEWYISLPRLLAIHMNGRQPLASAAPQESRFRADLIELYKAVLFYHISTVLSRFGSTEILDDHQFQADIVRLEHVLVTDGSDMDAQLRKLLEVEEAKQEAREKENEPTEESHEDSQSTGGSQETTQSAESPQENQPSEGPKEDTQSTKGPQKDDILDSLHATHPPLLESGSEDHASALLYAWAAGTSEYREWDESSSCRVLWVASDGGSCKTRLLRTIARRLSDESNQGVAYFFSDASHGSQRDTATGVVKSLIWQVLKSQGHLLSHLEHKLSSTGRSDFEGPSDFYAMATLLGAILQDSSFEPTCFVVDAMEGLCDETDDHRDFDSRSRDPYAAEWGPRDLMQLVMATSDMSNKVRWLVSTCHASVATDIFQRGGQPDSAASEADKNGSAPAMQRRLLIDSSRAGVREAVHEYAASKIRQLANETTYCGTLQEDVLKEMWTGSFHWVDMACHLIKLSGIPWNAPRILQGLQKDVQSLCGQLEEKLENLDDDDKDNCKTVLSTAAIAFRPLSIRELAGIVDLPPKVDLVVLVNRMCSSFLEVHERATRFVDFVNSSVRDHLRRGLKNNRILSKTHSRVVEGCLRIALERFPQEPQGNGGPNAVNYATLYWIRHLAQVDPGDLVHAIEQVNDFLRSHFMPWLEILASQRLLDQALTELQILEVILSKKLPSPIDKDTDSLFQHVRIATLVLRFHQSSGSPPELSPQNSVLFCPRTTELRQMLPQDLLELTKTLVLEPTGWALDSCTHVLKGHEDWVRDCAFVPDGRLVASVSDDATVRLWDAGTGRPQHVIAGEFPSYIYNVAISTSGLLAASDNAVIQLWQLATGKFEKRLDPQEILVAPEEAREGEVLSCLIQDMTISPNGDMLVATTEDAVIAWNLPSYRSILLAKLTKPEEKEDRKSETEDENEDETDSESEDETKPYFGCVRFSGDGRLLAWVTINDAKALATIDIWDVRSGKVQHKLINPSYHQVISIAFSHDSTFLASYSPFGAARIWDAAKGEPLGELENLGTGVDTLFSPDEQRLASISGRSVEIWKAPTQGDIKNFQLEKILKGHPSRLLSISFSPNGDRLVSASRDKQVRIWRVEDALGVAAGVDQATNQDSPSRQTHTEPISLVEFSQNGELVASASLDGRIVLWDAEKGTQLHSFTGHTGRIKHFAFSKSGNILVSASIDRTVGVWDTSKGEGIRLDEHTDWVRCAGLCPQDRFLASASDDQTVRLWDLATLSRQQQDHRADADASGPATDEDQPAQTEQVHIKSTVLKGHEDYVFCVTFSPDGKYLASGGDEHRILLWDLAAVHAPDSDQEQRPYRELKDKDRLSSYIRGLGFSPDGTKLASTSADFTVALWSTETGRCFWSVAAEEGQRWGPSTLSFDPELPGVLLTALGPWKRRLMDERPSSPMPLSELPPWRSYTLNIEGRWVMWRDRKVIFLPEQYFHNSGECACAVYGTRFVVGNNSGEVLIFKLPEEPPEWLTAV